MADSSHTKQKIKTAECNILRFASVKYLLATVFYCCLLLPRLPTCNCHLMLLLSGRFLFPLASALF
ncbi:hypothetical protein [Methanimicrococcus hongohii]|uniref:hypothetical protein n=1 Tax=Methanimicrococcus hongohii TaxID=3028295 RepID=UPI00292E9602|nr:hypothetical protein [Methanimicrococcus sp. Hf6]